MTMKGELIEALESRRKSLEIFENLAKADPMNMKAQESLALSYVHFGDVLGNPESPNLGRQAEALKNYRLALGILRTIKRSDTTDNVKTREILQLIYQRMRAMRACVDGECK